MKAQLCKPFLLKGNFIIMFILSISLNVYTPVGHLSGQFIKPALLDNYHFSAMTDF
jgi:hypothetical protein